MRMWRQMRWSFVMGLFVMWVGWLAMNLAACPAPVGGEETTGDGSVADKTSEPAKEPVKDDTVAEETTQDKTPEPTPETTQDKTPETVKESTPETPKEPGTPTLDAQAASQKLDLPFDAIPGPEGKEIYYVTFDPPANPEDSRIGSLYKVATTAGATPQKLATDFVSPKNLTVSTDGATVFVADSGHTDATGDKLGAIFTVPSAGGNKTLLAGTEGYRARALDLVKRNNVDTLYFSGNDPADGKAAVFQMPALGGAITVVSKGESIREPSGIAVAPNGDVYLADSTGREGTGPIVYKIANNAVTEFASGLELGFPAGVALTRDAAFLLVSGISPKGGAAVFRISLSTKQVDTFDQGISQNTQSAGLHRAHNTDLFAWADAALGVGGVYRITLK